MRKTDTLGALAVLTVGLLALPGELGSLAAIGLAVAAYRAAASEFGPSRAAVSSKVGTLRTLTLRGR